MSDDKLTQADAERLLTMVKQSLESVINFPQSGGSTEFDLVGDSGRDLFAVKIFRGKINKFKYNFGARIKSNGILLLELHINPSSVHINPDTQEKITGTHWHLYSEEYGREVAFPADIESPLFVENTIKFLTEFNVIECPEIRMQTEFL